MARLIISCIWLIYNHSIFVEENIIMIIKNEFGKIELRIVAKGYGENLESYKEVYYEQYT